MYYLNVSNFQNGQNVCADRRHRHLRSLLHLHNLN